VIIQKFKKYLYSISLTSLKWYNKGKLKPDLISIFFEKCIFWAKLGIIPDFKKPTIWGAFLCNRKFYGDYKMLALVSDKLKVRDYVEKRIGKGYLQTLIDVVDNTEDIDEERYLTYPEQFVVKPNHASERVFINKEYNYSLFKRSIRGFMDEFGNRNNEFHYKQINKKLLIEEYLKPQKEPLLEYKVWVFNGRVELIVPSHSVYERKLSNTYLYRFYDRDWNEPAVQDRIEPAPLEDTPKQLAEIIQISEELAKGWDFIRVDLYLIDGAIKFGELTPTPSAGRSFFISLEDHQYLYNSIFKSDSLSSSS
jgi:hypothetical protein